MPYREEYDDGYDGLILGTKPGDIPGETSFGTDASQDYDDDIEDSLDRRVSRNTHRGHVRSSMNSTDGIGRFILPKAHRDAATGTARISYNDHLDIYRDQKQNISYNPIQYKLFDGEIADQLGRSNRHNGLNKSKHQYYEAYEPVRQNVAVLRNALYTVYFPDGEYDANDPKDRAKAVKINQIGRKLAHKMKWETRWQLVKNVLTLGMAGESHASKHFGRFGEEHFGAQAMYDMLYRDQESFSLNPFRWIQGKTHSRDWDLPHPEDSPFSDRDMHEAMQDERRDDRMGLHRSGPELCGEALEIEGIAAALKAGAAPRGVVQMSQEKRSESVELGREILRKLKEINAGRSDRAHDGLGTEREDIERAHMMHGLAENYLELYNDLLLQDPSIKHDSTFERARLAIGKLGHLTMLDAMKNASSPEERKELEAAYAALPDEYKQVRDDNESDLVRDVEVAMEEMGKRQNVGRTVDPSVRSRAQGAVNDMHNTMSSVRIGAASRNINLVNMAREVNQMNEQMGRDTPSAADLSARR
ncbi:MAG: hypothetical protein P8P30_04760 [Rickettsiales bacterium]|nr:hypothetical protein [Rickettsiales bacterium]